MEEVIVHNGKEYTREEVLEMIEKVVEVAKQAYETFVNACVNIASAIKETYYNFLYTFINNPPVGLKREFKMGKLIEYESMSEGKSNNWRKMHGLSVKRKVQ